MKCDFRNGNLTKQKLFMSKLSGEPIHFGYIPIWRLRAFIRFCKENEIITAWPKDSMVKWHKTNYHFCYTITDSQSFFAPLEFVMILLSDLLGGYTFTPFTRCLRTRKATITCGGDQIDNKWRYMIRNGLYIV